MQPPHPPTWINSRSTTTPADPLWHQPSCELRCSSLWLQGGKLTHVRRYGYEVSPCISTHLAYLLPCLLKWITATFIVTGQLIKTVIQEATISPQPWKGALSDMLPWTSLGDVFASIVGLSYKKSEEQEGFPWSLCYVAEWEQQTTSLMKNWVSRQQASVVDCTVLCPNLSFSTWSKCGAKKCGRCSRWVSTKENISSFTSADEHFLIVIIDIVLI